MIEAITTEVAGELQHVEQAAEEARRAFRAAREAVRSSWALDDERITELAESAEDAAWVLVVELETRAVDLRAYLRDLEASRRAAPARPAAGPLAEPCDGG